MSKKIATREAYGKALAALANTNENVVVLDCTLFSVIRYSQRDFLQSAPSGQPA